MEIRTNSREVEPGGSPDQWLGRMGIHTAGKTYRLVRGASAIVPPPAFGMTCVIVVRALPGRSSLHIPPVPGAIEVAVTLIDLLPRVGEPRMQLGELVQVPASWNRYRYLE
jgi:hypothetical protein